MAYIKFALNDDRAHARRHNRAVEAAYAGKLDPGSIIVRMLQDWHLRATWHLQRFGACALIGRDHHCGDAWIDIGISLRVMLSQETNSELDHAMLDTFIVQTIKEFGGTIRD